MRRCSLRMGGLPVPDEHLAHETNINTLTVYEIPLVNVSSSDNVRL